MNSSDNFCRHCHHHEDGDDVCKARAGGSALAIGEGREVKCTTVPYSHDLDCPSDVAIYPPVWIVLSWSSLSLNGGRRRSLCKGMR